MGCHCLLRQNVWDTVKTVIRKNRVTLVDDKVVMFEFKSGINTPENVCDTQIVNILDSIELK